MKPDTITVRIIAETELDADSADLTVVIEGSKVFSGSEALKKAKEVRELVDSLREVGLDEARIKLRSVEVNSQSFAIIKSSCAKYTLIIKTVSLEMLPTACLRRAFEHDTREWSLAFSWGTRRRCPSTFGRNFRSAIFRVANRSRPFPNRGRKMQDSRLRE